MTISCVPYSKKANGATVIVVQKVTTCIGWLLNDTLLQHTGGKHKYTSCEMNFTMKYELDGHFRAKHIYRIMRFDEVCITLV